MSNGLWVLGKKTPNSKRSVLLTHNSRGLSLVEVLIAVAILSIIAFVAIPNLNQFNDNQDFINETYQLRDIIQKAQSGSRTGIRCSNNGGSQRWNVILEDTRYYIRINCEGGVNETQNDISLLPGVTIATPCGNNDLLITVSNYMTAFSCSDGTVLAAPVTVTLAQGTQTRNLIINAAGIVSD